MKSFLRLLAFLAVLVAAPANATVTSAQNKVIISGNNVQTSFPFSFVGVAASDISVIFTNASGVSTTLVQGPGSTQYQVTLTAAAPGQLWGVGGTVVYNPGGTPIATGTTLTIVRTVPLTQSTSLQNQASFGQYAAATEKALDQVDMQVQQIAEAQNRVLSAPIVDPSSINLTLPPAAQRANSGLAFDGSGNVIAGTVPASGTISTAMQPVVSAATLAAGRTAFGLGTVALENTGGTCGGGTLQDDGSGNLRIVFHTVADGINQSVTCAFHGTQHAATAAIIYTLPQANTLFDGFSFWLYANGGPVTITPNAADSFPGMAGGASMIIPQGTQAFISTNASGSGTWYITVQNPTGMNAAFNLQLSCSVTSNALTCSVLDRNGNAPSAASPVLLSFRDPTAANGDPVARAITGALSVTVPSSATLGTVNGQANRIWIADFDNAGTHVLGVYNSLNSSAPSVLAWDETTPTNGTGITSGSTSAQTWYTASSVTTKSFRILGYVESTQSTAGTWAGSPSKVQLFGPGIKKPGDLIQEQTATISSADTTSSATFVALTNNRILIAPSSAANLIRVEATGAVVAGLSPNPGAAVSIQTRLSRGVTAATNLFGNISIASYTVTSGFSTIGSQAYNFGYDLPNTTSSTTYAVQGNVNVSGPMTYGGSTQLVAREIQI